MSAHRRRSRAGTRRRFWTALLLIATAALGLRVVYVLAVARHDHHFYDAFYYEAEADSLAKGGGIVEPSLRANAPPDADHPPLTELVLAPVSKVFDGKQTAMRLTMAVLGSVVVVVIGLIGAEVAGETVGLLAAAIAAVYPNLWANDGVVMAETLATLTVALAVLCTYRMLRSPSWRWAVGAGLAAGLAALARGELVLVVLVVLVALALSRALPVARRVQLGAVVVVVAGLTIAPWIVRNLRTFDQPVFLSTGDGLVLLGSNCDSTYYGTGTGYWDGACGKAGEVGLPPGADASVVSKHQRNLAFDYIRAHKSRVPAVVAARLGRGWSVYKIREMARDNVGEGRPRAVSYAGDVVYWCLVPLAVVGAMVLRRRRVPLSPLLGQVVLVVVVTAAFYGLVRFRVPAEVAIVVLAAAGIERIVARRRGERAPVAVASVHSGR